MVIKRFLSAGIIVLLLLGVLLPNSEASEKISSESVKFQRTGWEVDGKGANVFVGNLQNLSGKEIEFIGLRCGFFDAGGVQLEHGIVILRDILKDGYAKFEFYPPAPAGTVTATITEVDVYAK